MRSVTLITIVTICTMIVLQNISAYPAVGTGRMDGDSFFFPDQAEYFKLAAKCADGTVLWLGDRRCYREGEQGPCNIGRVITLDKKYWSPKCVNEPLQ